MLSAVSIARNFRDKFGRQRLGFFNSTHFPSDFEAKRTNLYISNGAYAFAMAGEDVVTDLQNQISHVTAGLFNFVGALQRDAPPASVFDEPIITPPTQNIDVQVRFQAHYPPPSPLEFR